MCLGFKSCQQHFQAAEHLFEPGPGLSWDKASASSGRVSASSCRASASSGRISADSGAVSGVSGGASSGGSTGASSTGLAGMSSKGVAGDSSILDDGGIVAVGITKSQDGDLDGVGPEDIIEGEYFGGNGLIVKYSSTGTREWARKLEEDS